MGWGMGWVGGLYMLIIFVLIVIGGIAVARWALKSGGGGADSALEILKRRYARGEITKEQFEEMKKDIL
jgi:putative membrane protein